MKNWDDASEECGVCKYWEDVGGVLSDQGACRRFPGRAVLTLHFNWCGEFKLYSREAFERRQKAEAEYTKRFPSPPVDAPSE